MEVSVRVLGEFKELCKPREKFQLFLYRETRSITRRQFSSTIKHKGCQLNTKLFYKILRGPVVCTVAL